MGIQISCDECHAIITNDTYYLCRLCRNRPIICHDCSVKHIVEKHLEEVINDNLYKLYDRVDAGLTIAEKMKLDVKNGKQKNLIQRLK